MEKLKGRPTTEVVTWILKNNPQIERFYFNRFMPGFSDQENNSSEIFPMDAHRVYDPEWLAQIPVNSMYPLIGLASVVDTLDGRKHIPMLDVDEGYGRRAVDRLRRTLDYFSLPGGIIAASGSGLHYLGMDLIEPEQFENSVDQADSKINAHLDRNWVWSSKERGYFVLRMGSGEGKPNVPVVHGLYRVRRRDLNAIRRSVAQMQLLR